MMPISAGIRNKSAIDAIGKVTKQTNIAINEKRVFKTGTGLETHIA